MRPDVAVNGPLGAQFLAWEYATAIAGRVLGINPFDQPNVTESKENTNRILADGLPGEEPSFIEGAVEVLRAGAGTDLAGALRWLLGRIGDDGYLAVHGLPRPVRRRRGRRAARRCSPRASGRPVTFGWGPRFLHSTGQYHKGGPQVGVVPADHRRGHRRTCRCPASRTPSASCRRPRPPATGRRWPAAAARCCTCT